MGLSSSEDFCCSKSSTNEFISLNNDEHNVVDSFTVLSNRTDNIEYFFKSLL